VKDIDDVITHAKFGDDRLRGSGGVAGQISAFPIDFAGRPYNTLTLQCERVMGSRCLRVTWSGASSGSYYDTGLLFGFTTSRLTRAIPTSRIKCSFSGSAAAVILLATSCWTLIGCCESRDVGLLGLAR